MLLAIRDKAKGWIAWVVIILIGAAFALFGLSSYITPSGEERAVATINGRDISPDAVTRMYQQQRSQIQQMMGDSFDPSMFDEQELRLEALNRVIDQHLLTEYIESRNLRLSDRDLAAVIRSLEVFQENGRFSSSRYNQLLEANRMTGSQYEAQIRRATLIDQIQAAVSDTALVMERDLQQLISLQLQERDISYLTLDMDAYRESVSVSEEEMEAYYNERRADFQSPERVRLEWVELTRDAIKERLDIDEDAVRERYDQVADSRFTEPASRDVRHILVALDRDADAAAQEAARERIEQLRARIMEGESFADVAREASDDTDSGSDGGDLGKLEPGDMVEAFDEAAFALDEGELSEPVRSPFGLHLIQATAVRGGERQPFNEVRERLRDEIAGEQVENRFFDLSNRLSELAFEYPDSLDEAAERLELELQRSDWVRRDGESEGIGSHSGVRSEAFSNAVLEDGFNSDLIEISSDRYAVVRVVEHERPRQLEFQEVADTIRDQLKEQRARDAIRERAEGLMISLRDAPDLSEAVEGESGVRLASPGYLNRESSSLPRAAMREGFSLPRPPEDKRSTGLVRLPNDGYAVVVVSGVRDGDLSEISDEDRREIRREMRQAYGQEAVRDFLRELRAQADVKIFEDRLDPRF